MSTPEITVLNPLQRAILEGRTILNGSKGKNTQAQLAKRYAIQQAVQKAVDEWKAITGTDFDSRPNDAGEV